MKLSEALFEADRRRIKQVREQFYDGKGGMCAAMAAKKVLSEAGEEQFENFEQYMRYLELGLVKPLSLLNDTDKLSFKKIAKYLQERNL